MPIGLDSGVDVDDQLLDHSAPHWAKHRLVFGRVRTHSASHQPPRLASGRHKKIRLLAGWAPAQARAAGSPAHAAPAGRTSSTDPLPENFSAPQLLDSWSGRSLHDWTTFHQGGLRLIEHLQYVGYNGLMISVVADGSSIYPTALVEPTPRYDTWACSSVRPRTRCEKTCWKCCSGSWTARTCG